MADFGIAHIVGGTRHTVSGALMGTLSYMAPEQGLESRADVCSDIYSLGIVLYEMLTQHTPFEADTPLAILMKHVNDPLPLPRKSDPTIPEPVERVVLRALAKRPEDRYQSAAEMAEALRQAAEEAEIELPASISLPLSFTTDEAPLEQVAVFSGEVREKITDVDFAENDTDTTLSKKMAAKPADASSSAGQMGKELISALGAMGESALTKTAQVLRDTAEAAVRGDGDAPAVEERPRAGLAVLVAFGLVFTANLCMVSLAAPTGLWSIYEKGWPIELFLVSLGLSMIMWVCSSIWMMIPSGIVLGTGILLGYTQSTGNWHHWNFLWVFEVWFVVGSIWLPIWLSKYKSRVRAFARLVALVLGSVAVGCISITLLLSGLSSLFQ